MRGKGEREMGEGEGYGMKVVVEMGEKEERLKKR